MKTLERWPAIDAMRVVAAHAIVWHHLAIYTAMADTAWSLAPDVFRALADHARKAVQVFLVMSGFLVARSLLPDGVLRLAPSDAIAGEAGDAGASARFAARALLARIRRLAPLAWLAMALAMVVQAWVGKGVDPTSSAPGWAIVLANAVFLQDVVGLPSLSAGLWYVAIDLQLFAGALLLACMTRSARVAIAGTTIAVLLSAFVFNLDARGDAYAPYFMAAHGLGMLAWWGGGRSAHGRAALIVATLGVTTALVWDFRDRMLIALATAWVLAAMSARVQRAAPDRATLRRQADATYALFVLHYPVLIAADAIAARTSLTQLGPLSALAGLVATWLAAWALATAVHTYVEPWIARRVRIDR